MTSDRDATETPMSDHVARFWRYLESEHVHIVVNLRRENEGMGVYWDSATFSDDVAKALASVRPKPTTNDKAAADGIVDEIAQTGVSLDDKQWDFAVEAIEAALASVREEEREAGRLDGLRDAIDRLTADIAGTELIIDQTADKETKVALENRVITLDAARSRIRSRQTPTGTGESK